MSWYLVAGRRFGGRCREHRLDAPFWASSILAKDDRSRGTLRPARGRDDCVVPRWGSRGGLRGSALGIRGGVGEGEGWRLVPSAGVAEAVVDGLEEFVGAVVAVFGEVGGDDEVWSSGREGGGEGGARRGWLGEGFEAR